MSHTYAAIDQSIILAGEKDLINSNNMDDSIF